MANKAISELPQAQNVNNQDLFVLEQSGIAKKLTAETFITEQGIIDALAEALDGHGGIQSVTLQSLSGRVRTYLITFSDGSATTFQVYDGTTITSIQKTSTAGLVDTYTVYMSDGTTSFFQVRNGQDGSATWDQINSKAPIITETVTGAIANFPDGADDIPVTSLVADIEPVQNLNGYSNPWPAGGGGNIYDQSVRRMPISISAGTMLYLRKNDATIAFSVFALTDSENSITLGYLDGTEQVTVTLSENITLISITENSANTLINHGKTLMVSLAPITEVVPYSNICPITGRTGVNVTRTGKNLFANNCPSSGTVRSVTYTKNQDDSITLNGTVSGGNMYIQIAGGYYYDAVELPPRFIGKQLTISGGLSNVSVQFIEYTATGVGTSHNAFDSSTTFTVKSDTKYFGLFVFALNNTAIGTGTVYPMVAFGSTATAYEPYIAPATASISWQDEAGTVYGGTIDVATGLLTVDRAVVTFNGSDSSGFSRTTAYGSVTRFDKSVSGLLAGSGSFLVCNMLPVGAIGTANLECCNVHGSSAVIQMQISTSRLSADTVAGLMTYLSSNPISFCYKLATPVTYQLTPQEVKTLLGTNNVLADIGNVSVTYSADTKMFIEKLTMPTEDDMVANQAITSGKYFMIGNSLYLALANIASGAQITIGTNAQRVSLADALNTINS